MGKHLRPMPETMPNQFFMTILMLLRNTILQERTIQVVNLKYRMKLNTYVL